MTGPIPFDAPFGGYGVGPAPTGAATANPASYADEVRARVAQLHAPAAGGAPAPTPAAAVTGAQPAPFYQRPVNVPSWLKTAGGFGMRVLRGAGVVGGVATAAEYGGPLLEFGAKAAANAYVGAGSNMNPNPAVQAAQPPATPAPAAEPALVGADQATMGANNLRVASQPGFGVAAAPSNTAVPPRGTGFITNEQTGVTTNIDARGAAPAAADYTPRSAAGRFFQAGAKIKQISGDNAQNLAGARLLLDSITKGAEANKNNAQAGNFGVRTQAAVEHLKTNPGDFAGAGAIASGRSAGAGNFVESTTTLPGKNGEISLIDKRGGTVTKVLPSQRVTTANIDAYLRDNPTATRAAAIAAHKARGMDVAGLK